MKARKILVVEDQISPLDSIAYAIKKVIFDEADALPRIGNYSSEEVEQDLRKRKIDFARCYNEAIEYLNGEGDYDLVFLDHRMPYDNQTQLEKTDSRTFSDKMQDIGYQLIPSIRKFWPNAKIIGTSSLSEVKLKEFDNPHFYLDKNSVRTIDKDLAQILREIEEGTQK